MYITFLHNEKGNFYISNKVIEKIVQETILNITKNIKVEEIDVEIPRGLQIFIKIVLLLEKPDKKDIDPAFLIEQVKIIINELLSFSPYNISLSIKKNK